MARYEPPEDPDNVPTRYADYSSAPHGSPTAGSGYGPTDYPAPVDEPIAPWYLKPGVLMIWGALVAFLLAVVIWGIVELVSRDSGHSTAVTTTVTTTAVAPTTLSTTSTTTATTTSTQTTETTTTAPTTTTDTAESTTGTPQTTDTPVTSTAPTTTTTAGGFQLPHMPTQFTLPALPTVIELPPRH